MAKKLSDLDDDTLDLGVDDEEEVKKSPNKMLIGILVTLVVAAVLILGGKLIADIIIDSRKDKGPVASTKVIGVANLFTEKEGSYPLILDGEVSEYRIYDFNGTLYVNRKVVLDEIDCRFYYDEDTKAILYTTSTETYSFFAEKKGYVDSSGKEYELEYAPVMENENGIYIALDILNFGRTMSVYYVYDAPKRVSLWTYEKENQFDNCTLTKDAPMREGNNITNHILVQLKAGDKVTILDESYEDFYYVMAQGVKGYVEKEAIDTNVTEALFVKNEPYYNKQLSYKVSMGWAQVTNTTANNYIIDYIKSAKGLNVVSPTWYKITDENGEISSIATQKTVNEIHNAGCAVWPLVSDFEVKIDTDELLKSSVTRRKIIDRLINDAVTYKFDGYNIDFEAINENSADDFLQFLRELAIECNKIGIILSSDNYVPMPHTSFYNREEQGKIVDYVVAMAYDEHYAGSPESGSVASISFVTNGIDNTIKEVGEPSRVLVGLPFYARLWVETYTEDGKFKLSSSAYGMKGIKNVVDKNNAQIVWSETEGQYYAQYEIGNKTYKAWIEDLRSYEEKMKVVADRKIGGVAFWRLGLEDPDVYDVVNKYLKE